MPLFHRHASPVFCIQVTPPGFFEAEKGRKVSEVLRRAPAAWAALPRL